MKPVFLRKISDRRGNLPLAITVAEGAAAAEGADVERSRTGCWLVRACHRRAAQLRRRLQRRRIRRRGPVDHAAEAAQSGLCDPPQHQIVGRGPGVASGLAGRFLAGKAQCALLVAVVDVPDPRDRGAAAADLRRRDSFARDRRPRIRGTRSTGCEASIRCPARRPSGRTPAAAGRRSIRTPPWPHCRPSRRAPLAAPPPAQPPRPQAIANSHAAIAVRDAVRPARNRVAKVSLITPSDIVKTH